MNHYQGHSPSDRVYKGGKYVEENETGGEVHNFQPFDGWCHGYVQPSGGNINLQSLGAAPGATITRDVTIVFTATGPSVGNVVIGWYKKAQVWRNLQRNNGRFYFARAKATNCTLLTVDERVLTVPRPARAEGKDAWVFGRSNIRYVSGDDENTEFVRKLRAYIEDPFQVDLLGNGRHGQSPFPRRVDPLRRAKVEKAAIEYVINFYRSYNCHSVERENKGWDLELRRGPVELFVEVK